MTPHRARARFTFFSAVLLGASALAPAAPARAGGTTHLRTEPVAVPCVAAKTCAYRPPLARFVAPRGGTYQLGAGVTLGAGYRRCRYRAELRATKLPRRVLSLQLVLPPPDALHHRGLCRALPRAGGSTTVELDAGEWTIEAYDARVTLVRLLRASPAP